MIPVSFNISYLILQGYETRITFQERLKTDGNVCVTKNTNEAAAIETKSLTPRISPLWMFVAITPIQIPLTNNNVFIKQDGLSLNI
jgi:hypothetical protein